MSRIAPIIVLVVGLLVISGVPTASAEEIPARQNSNDQTSGLKQEASRVPVPVPSPKAIAYYRSGIPLWFLGRGLALAIPLLILVTGLSSRIRRFASGKQRPWLITIAIYSVLFLSLEFLLNLPYRYYMGFVRSHDYGLSVQTFDRWFFDVLKGLMVEVVSAILFIWVPYLLMGKSPKRWWLYTGLLILPTAGFSALIAPIVIDPLYNDFGPMKNKELEAKIDALARRAGIDGGKIFEVNKSLDTTTVNAYVTGLFGTKRIVLWDTLLAKLDEDEVLVMMGHEMGHYALNHVIQGLLLSSFGSIFALYLIHRTANALIRRYHGRFGFERLSDIASVPLILSLAQITMFLGSPLINGMSRQMEHEADRFALEITQTNHSAAVGFSKLQVDNLAVPYPGWLMTMLRSTHPSIGDRIDFCNTYRPWESGEPLRYGSYFRQP